MDISGLAAQSLSMIMAKQQNATNIAMTKQNIESSTQVAQMASEQAAENAKAAAQAAAATTGKVDITA